MIKARIADDELDIPTFRAATDWPTEAIRIIIASYHGVGWGEYLLIDLFLTGLNYIYYNVLL